ncbi:Ig domain protein group 2 domain protein (fragment) [Vibrio coralliirubri]|uniref:Ig-like domain-containing protein n=1 Tax=Vibrio coralliirubri TaxID=1516159 RepID=UPI0006311196
MSDWHTSNSDSGRFDEPGVFTAANEGYTTVTATKDGITSNTVNVNVSAAVITAIQVTPLYVNVTKGHTEQLTATATFSDATSSDVSNSVTWGDFDTATATVSPTGLFSAVEAGNTILTATKDGITSDTVDVNVCGDPGGACIDIFDTGSGKLFTSTPSVAYLDSIGGSPTDNIYSSDGQYGPAGDFYKFKLDSANTLCDTYNTHSLEGRTNWGLASYDELSRELYGVYGNMFLARGWLVSSPFWSSTTDDGRPKGPEYYYGLRLSNGDEFKSDNKTFTLTASCVSNP